MKRELLATGGRKQPVRCRSCDLVVWKFIRPGVKDRDHHGPDGRIGDSGAVRRHLMPPAVATVEQWLAGPRFAALKSQLQIMGARLETFVTQAAASVEKERAERSVARAGCLRFPL